MAADKTVKVYGWAVAPVVARALLALEEAGVGYELVAMSRDAGDHRRPDHLARNRFGKVAVLEDGELTLFGPEFVSACLGQEKAIAGTMSSYSSIYPASYTGKIVESLWDLVTRQEQEREQQWRQKGKIVKNIWDFERRCGISEESRVSLPHLRVCYSACYSLRCTKDCRFG